MIKPKLLEHRDGHLYAFLGFNAIAFRFGRRIKTCRVKHIWGPFYRKVSGEIFDSVDDYKIPEGVS